MVALALAPDGHRGQTRAGEGGIVLAAEAIARRLACARDIKQTIVRHVGIAVLALSGVDDDTLAELDQDDAVGEWRHRDDIGAGRHQIGR